MKKLLSIFAVSALFLTACGAAGNDEAAQQTVHDAIVALSQAQSGEFTMELDADASAMEGEESVSFGGTLSGAYDNTERNNPQFSLAVNGTGQANGEGEETVDAEMRITDETMYFVVNEISSMGGEIPVEMVTAFLGKWYYMEMPADFVSTFNVYSGEDTELTEEEKAMKELFENTNFFTNVQREGGEEVDNVDTTKYDVDLDKAAVMAYIKESSNLSGLPMSESEVADMEAFFAALEFDGYVWVDSDGVLKKVEAEIAVADYEGMDELEASLSYTAANVGKDVEVEVPAGAELFDPFALLMGAGGGMPEGI